MVLEKWTVLKWDNWMFQYDQSDANIPVLNNVEQKVTVQESR